MSVLMLVLGLLTVFAGVALALFAAGAVMEDRRAVGRSLAAVAAVQAAPESMRKTVDQPFTDRVVGPAQQRLTAWGRRVTADEQATRIQRKLELAGNPAGWDVDRVIAFKMLGALVGGVLGLVVGVLLGGFLVSVGVFLVAIAFGFFLPNITLYQVAYNRTEQMRRELPDALDLLTISVEAGLSFDAAVSQVARNTTGPVAEEFFRVLQEMQIGTGRLDAIRALGERTDLPELRGFVTAMVQADAFGVPVANVLRVQATELRVKRSQRAEEMAQKVPVKILFPLIFCILPPLFIVILGPAAITIFENFGSQG